MQKNYYLMESLKYNDKQKYLILKEKNEENRRQILLWAQNQKYQAHLEQVSFCRNLLSIKCGSCGHKDKYQEKDCDCGCDESEYHFECWACSEMIFKDRDSFPESQIEKKKISKLTGYIIILKEPVENYECLTPTIEGKWK